MIDKERNENTSLTISRGALAVVFYVFSLGFIGLGILWHGLFPDSFNWICVSGPSYSINGVPVLVSACLVVIPLIFMVAGLVVWLSGVGSTFSCWIGNASRDDMSVKAEFCKKWAAICFGLYYFFGVVFAVLVFDVALRGPVFAFWSGGPAVYLVALIASVLPLMLYLGWSGSNYVHRVEAIREELR